jgi:hypothetical protein
MTVQHVLAPTQSLPSPAAAIAPAIARTISAPVQPQVQPLPTRTPKGPKATTPLPVKVQSNKPPGLQLLQRMSKTGPPGAKQNQAA